MVDELDCNNIGGIPDGMGGCRIPNDFLDFVLGKNSCKSILKGILIDVKGMRLCSITVSPTKKEYMMLQEAKTSIYGVEMSGIHAFGNFFQFTTKLKDYIIARKFDKTLGTKLCTDEGVEGDIFEKTIQKHINESHLFEITDGVKILLSKTKPPNINDMFKLPFGTVFLDVNFKKDEMEKFGVEIGYDEIIGIMVTEGKMIRKKDSDSYVSTIEEYEKQESTGTSLRITILGVKGKGEEQTTQFDVFNRNVNLKPEYKDMNRVITTKTPDMCNKKAAKFAHEFVINFLNFIQVPEVTWKEKPADAERNKKRIGQGKLPVPPKSYITLTGNVKRYAQDIQEHPENWHYSYRFWVMGHWRTFQSPRYGDKIGTQVWVEHYVKGPKFGPLVEKKYILDNKSGREID